LLTRLAVGVFRLRDAQALHMCVARSFRSVAMGHLLKSQNVHTLCATGVQVRRVDAGAALRQARSTAAAWDRTSEWPVHRIRTFLQSQQALRAA